MNERELEELLRSRSEPMSPPPGRWEAVRRRARRRRVAKLSAAVLATVVVAAGIGLAPTVLFTHHNQASEQRISIAAQPSSAPQHEHASSAPTPVSSPSASASGVSGLRGFAPTSVSFVSQSEGFLLGTAGDQSALARTTDGGSSWSRLADLSIPAETAGVRFATPEVGYVFGTKFLMTTTGGRAWQAEPSPGGFISDLETMNGHVYALVSSCARCRKVTLYGGSTASPDLQAVAGVPTLVGDSVSLAVYRDAAYVLDTAGGGSGTVWGTTDGSTWSQHPAPCRSSFSAISAWSPLGIAAACAVGVQGMGRERVRVYTSIDGAAHWSALPLTPAQSGTTVKVSAADPAHVILTGSSAFLATADAGRHWSETGPRMDGSAFVGFISPEHAVGLPAPSKRLFTTSYDGGMHWVTYRFPR